jgi:capsular exopolysaccharide synthesis family protein
MSRIHEALKRAEQERVTGQPAQNSDPQAEHGVASPVVETAPPPPSKLHQPVLPHLSTAHVEAEPGTRPVQFDALWTKCKRATWKPNPSAIVFENSDPFFPGAEQFRTLRSRLYRLRETQPLQTILVSSAIPAEGKTVISANLAYALVRQHGCRVLLIDADLRSPRIHTLLGAPAGPGLAEYLQNTATEFDVTQRSGEEGFCFIPAGNHAKHPSELISSVRMKQFLERVRPAFDWIIIDSPPALPVADASVLGGMVDGVLFVVRANSTPSAASQKACKELRDAHLIGVVLNTAEESSGYNSYYSNSAYKNPPSGAQK